MKGTFASCQRLRQPRRLMFHTRAVLNRVTQDLTRGIRWNGKILGHAKGNKAYSIVALLWRAGCVAEEAEFWTAWQYRQEFHEKPKRNSARQE